MIFIFDFVRRKSSVLFLSGKINSPAFIFTDAFVYREFLTFADGILRFADDIRKFEDGIRRFADRGWIGTGNTPRSV
jgi:hypothetical protein